MQLLHGQGSTMSVLPADGSGAKSGAANKRLSSASLVPGLVSTGGLTIQSTTAPTSGSAGASIKPRSSSNQQPSISITPLPRTTAGGGASSTPTGGGGGAGGGGNNKPSLSVSPVTPVSASAGGNAATPLTAKAGQTATAGQKGSVICEICDGYIKVMAFLFIAPSNQKQQLQIALDSYTRPRLGAYSFNGYQDQSHSKRRCRDFEIPYLKSLELDLNSPSPSIAPLLSRSL